MTGWIRRLWSGQVPLQEAFWTYAIGIGLLVNLTTSFLFLLLISADRALLAFIVGYVLSVPYNILALVGVWRAAASEPGNGFRADLYRVAALIWLLLLSLT